MMGAKSQADEASGPAELISSASKGRRHDRSRDVHSIFKATLDHGAPSRQDRSPGESRHSGASAKKPSRKKAAKPEVNAAVLDKLEDVYRVLDSVPNAKEALGLKVTDFRPLAPVRPTHPEGHQVHRL
jgi:hypothetical protein